MAELQREGEPWDDGTHVRLRAREYWMLNGQRASDVYEVAVEKKGKSKVQIKKALLDALKAKCEEREALIPEHKVADVELPELLTL